MAEIRETCIECVNVDDIATFCSSETKWINKILKLKESYPDEVDIKCMPDENYGVLLAHIPKSWMYVRPPKRINYSEEYKQQLSERLKLGRELKKEKDDG